MSGNLSESYYNVLMKLFVVMFFFQLLITMITLPYGKVSSYYLF